MELLLFVLALGAVFMFGRHLEARRWARMMRELEAEEAAALVAMAEMAEAVRRPMRRGIP